MTDDIATTNLTAALSSAISSAANMYACAAIVGVLAQRKVLKAEEVARMADFFAKNQPDNLGPEISAGISEQLSQFSMLIRAMAKMPKGSGRA